MQLKDGVVVSSARDLGSEVLRWRSQLALACDQKCEGRSMRTASECNSFATFRISASGIETFPKSEAPAPWCDGRCRLAVQPAGTLWERVSLPDGVSDSAASVKMRMAQYRKVVSF